MERLYRVSRGGELFFALEQDGVLRRATLDGATIFEGKMSLLGARLQRAAGRCRLQNFLFVEAGHSTVVFFPAATGSGRLARSA